MSLSSRFLVGTLVLLTVLPASATPIDLSNATSLEKSLFDDARDGQLDSYSMIDAAFIASGLPDEDALGAYRQKYSSLLAGARRLAGREETDYARAKAAFDYLHSKLLRTYGLHSVDMIGVFARGEYNCVSATVLFNAILEDLNLQSWGVLVPSHAYSIVRVEGRDVEVETTSPRGFDPARTDEAYHQLLKQYGLDGALFNSGAGRAKGASLIREVEGEKKPVGNLTMIAVIYSNLAAARVRDGDLEGALANFVKASALSSENPHFQRSRDALLNNLVVDLVEAGNYLQAVAAASAARKIPGLDREMLDKLVSLQAHATTKRAMELAASGKHREAIDAYDQGLHQLGDVELLLHNRKAGYVNWAIALTADEKYREAATILLTALALYPDAAIVQNNYLATVQKYIRSRKQARDLDHAEQIARHAFAQADALYRRGGNPAEMLLRLQLEIGLVLFASEDYAAAIEYMVPGLATGKDLYAVNYLAASGNLAAKFLKAGQSAEAYTAVLAAIRLVESSVAARHGFYRTYWPAAIAYSQALRKEGKAAQALQIATSAPATTLDGARFPSVYRAYWRERASILVDMGRKEECIRLVEGLPEMGESAWVEGLRSQCSR